MSGLTLTTAPRAGTARRAGQKILVVPESLEIRPLIDDLEKNFQCHSENPSVKVRKWFDTDDWRLCRRNFLLFHAGRTWHLLQRDSGAEVDSLTSRASDMFRFAEDFPASGLREALEPIISIRALLPMITQVTSSVCVRILNRDRKTVAFVSFHDHVTRENGASFRTVSLKGVRGYDTSFNEVSRFFAACGVKEKGAYSTAFVRGVKTLGRSPLDYTSKFHVELQPNMTARQAMIQIYRQLLQTMKHNENGIVQDLDTEFLHDFRVAIRRTRSGLGQVKEVLPPAVAEKIRKDFSWLGCITGPTRDLDVYLLDREKYMCRLPEHLRPKLRHFFVDLAEQREEKQKKLAASLQSDEYRRVVGDWHAYLHGAETGVETSNSERPASELAREIIFRKYRKILKNGRSIKPSSSDEELHRLRIQCKKLRYVLEFFTPLFPAGKIRRAIKQLRRLQDNLGVLNDLSVQQDMLQQYLSGLRPGSRKNQELAVAIGGLLTNLHHEQQRVREGFTTRFKRFSCTKNQQLFTELFG